MNAHIPIRRNKIQFKVSIMDTTHENFRKHSREFAAGGHRNDKKCTFCETILRDCE